MAKILKYDSIRMKILHYIAENNLRPGDRLPSVRQLIHQVDGSMISLRRAMKELEFDGIVELRSGGQNPGSYLKRSIYSDKWDFYILYINICRGNEKSGEPLEQQLGIVTSYFNSRGLGVKFFSVSSIEDDIILKAHNASAILLDGWFDDKIVAQLETLRLPMILIGNRKASHKKETATVMRDNVQAASLAFRQCVADGRRKIALLRGEDDYYSYNEYEEGYRQAAKEHGMAPIIGCSPREKGLRGFLEEFMPGNTDIDGRLLSHTMFDRVISWYWRNHVTAQPEFIFLDHTPVFCDVIDSPYMRWITFDSIGLTAAGQLMDGLLNNRPPQSRLLAPRLVRDEDFWTLPPIQGAGE